MACHKPHVLILPLSVPGHINPLMQISAQLVSQGLYVTLVVSQRDYACTMEAKGNMLDRNQEQLMDVKVSVANEVSVEHPEIKSPADERLLTTLNEMRGMREGVEELVGKLQGEGRPATLMIADVFVTWAHEVTDKFDIPLLAFFTGNATACSVFYRAGSLKRQGILPLRDENGNFIAKDTVTCIQGVPPLHPRDFPCCLTCPSSHFRFRFILEFYDNYHKSCGVVMNTFEEMESNAIAALREDFPIYSVGPLLLLGGQDLTSVKPDISYFRQEDHCLKWLETRPTSSILYISFGSDASLSPAQTKDLALGLEASHQPFLWVIRKDSVAGSLSDILPPDFLSRTKDWGLVISWAPQVSVLAHPSIGGFLSHCGWNSTVENIGTRCVPMICWPHAAEQRMNCRLLVDHWKIAMEFKANEDGVVPKEEVERVVIAVMKGQEGRDMRIRCSKLHDEAMKAVQGGSSQANMKALVQVAYPKSKE